MDVSEMTEETSQPDVVNENADVSNLNDSEIMESNIGMRGSSNDNCSGITVDNCSKSEVVVNDIHERSCDGGGDGDECFYENNGVGNEDDVENAKLSASDGEDYEVSDDKGVGSEDEDGEDEDEDEEDEDEDEDEDGDGNDDSISEDDEDSARNDKILVKERNNNSHIENDVVSEVLAQEALAVKSISVCKHIELEYDLGRLLAVDTNEMDLKALSNSREDYLKDLARDNTQLLINKVWQLPISRKDNDIVVKLPKPKYKLPREKRVPKPKQPTKWQKFAEEKGISKKRRGNVQWDETLQKWIPWWGYKKVKAEKEKNWAIEVRRNDDPMVDPFAKKKAEKKERIAKNEYQRLRNLAKAKNVNPPRGSEKTEKNTNNQSSNLVNSNDTSEDLKQLKKRKPGNHPRMGLLTMDKMTSEEMKKAVTITKSSTASLGKFQPKLSKEKKAKNVSRLLPMTGKRKIEHMRPEKEKATNMKVIDGILNKKPKLNVVGAVNKHIYEEQQQRAEEKKAQKPKGKKRRSVQSSGKGKFKGKGKGKMNMGRKNGAKERAHGGKGGKGKKRR